MRSGLLCLCPYERAACAICGSTKMHKSQLNLLVPPRFGPQKGGHWCVGAAAAGAAGGGREGDGAVLAPVV